MRVLFVCTANICRSPLAAALFTKSAIRHGSSDAVTASAGFLEGGRPVHEHVAAVLDQRGVDASRKKSQKLNDDVVKHADLILTMTSEHARGVVARFPESISKVFTLRHFGGLVSPRATTVSPSDWLHELHVSNRRSYLGDDALLDIPDPIGHSYKVFEGLATELENTIGWIMDCAYPVKASVSATPGQY